MAWTEQDEARLAQLEAKYGGGQSPGMSPLPRAGAHLLNFIPDIQNTFTRAVSNAVGMMQPEPMPPPVMLPTMDIPAPQTTGELLTDIGAGIGRTVATAMLPAGAVTRGASLLGRAAPIAGDIAAGAIMGMAESPAESAGTAAEFAGLGATRFLPRLARLPFNIGIPVAGQLIRGQDPMATENLIGTGAQAVLGSFGRPIMRRAAAEPSVSTIVADEIIPPSRGGMMALPGPTVAPSGRHWNMLEWPHGEARTFSPSGEIIATHPASISQGRPLALPGPITTPDARPWNMLTWPHGEARTFSPTGEPIAPIPVSPEMAPTSGVIGRQLRSAVQRGAPPPTIAPDLHQVASGIGFKYDGDITAGNKTLHQFTELKGGPTQGGTFYTPGGASPDAIVAILTNKRANFVAANKGQQGGAGIMPLLSLASGGVGATAGYAQDPEETGIPRPLMALIGGLAGAAAPTAGRNLLRIARNPAAAIAEEQKLGVLPQSLARAMPKTEAKLEGAARAQERGAPTALGAASRWFERAFNTNRTASVQTAIEQAKGNANLAAHDAVEAAKAVAPFRSKWDADLAGADPVLKAKAQADLTAVEAYNHGPGGAAEELALQRAVGAAAGPIIKWRAIEEGLQSTLGQAMGGKHAKLVQETFGTYDTRAYDAFLRPDQWAKEVTPARRDAFVSELMGHRSFRGMPRWQVEEAADAYKADVIRAAKGESPLGSSQSTKVSQHLWTKRKELGPATKEFLGEIKNPVEVRALTLAKLIGSAAQSKTIVELGKLTDDTGSPMVMSLKQQEAAVNAALAAGDTARVDALKAYQVIPDAPGWGKLGGMVAPRGVIDALNAHKDSIGSGYQAWISAANNIIKESMTVANPATHARNWLQIIFQGTIARTKPVDYARAVEAIREKRDTWRKLVRLNILNADFSSAELRRGARDLDALFGGPKTLGQKAKGTLNAVRKIYGLPDNIVRAAAYLSNESRFLDMGRKQGLTGADLARFAEEQTMQFVNRYTMNYGAVAPAVKWLRNKPFVSPFISYASEMGRILKNLGEDALQGDPETRAWALANIGQLLAMPAALSTLGYAALPDRDKKEWDRVERLGPTYMRSQIKIPLGRKPDGTFRYISFGPMTPAGDYVAMARNLARGDMEALWGQHPWFGLDKTPLFNLAQTLARGEDAFTREPVTTAGERAMAVGRAVAPPWVPGVGFQGKRIVRAFTPNAGGGLGLTDERTGRSDTVSEVGMSLAGLPIASVKPQALLRRASAERDDAIRKAEQKARPILRSDATPARKQAERATLMRKRQEIEERYRLSVTE